LFDRRALSYHLQDLIYHIISLWKVPEAQRLGAPHLKAKKRHIFCTGKP